MGKLKQILYFALGLSIGLTLGSFLLQNYPLSLTSWPSLYISSSSLMLLTQPPPLPPPWEPPPSSTPPLPSSIINDGSSSGNIVHNMSDNELLLRASMVPQKDVNPIDYLPKVAFMFLTKGPLPLAPLWDLFFKGHEGSYTIYVHTHPSYNYSWPQDSVFYGRRIPSQLKQLDHRLKQLDLQLKRVNLQLKKIYIQLKQKVLWGTMSMVDAERRLLANALLDVSNQRFVLLSESCIPLFNFSTIYSYLMNSKLSFLASSNDQSKHGRGRYNPKMSPNITLQEWRKGSQWFELHREVAVLMISDQKYYSVFKEHCHIPCYNNEHYMPTLGHMLAPTLIANKSITWVDWSHVGPYPGSHPGRFIRRDITEEFLNHIRFELSNCTYNGNVTSMCFLFARKFVGDTLRPLLQIAPRLLGFDP